MDSSQQNFRSSLGRALRLFRQFRGMSQEDLADTSSRTYLSDVERGRKALTVEKLRFYAARLQVQTASIVALAEALENANASNVLADLIAAEIDAASAQNHDISD